MSIILRRMPVYMGKYSIPHLIEIATQNRDQDEKTLSKASEDLMKAISVYFSDLYSDHIEVLLIDCQELIALLSSEDESLVNDSLGALSKFVKVHPEKAPTDKASLKKLFVFVKQGTLVQSKRAAVLLSRAIPDSNQLKDFVHELLLDISAPSLQTVSALTSFAMYASSLVQDAFPQILEYIETSLSELEVRFQLIFQETEVGPDWVEFSELNPTVQSVILAIKVLVHLLINPEAQEQSDDEKAGPLLVILQKLIEKEGKYTDKRIRLSI